MGLSIQFGERLAEYDSMGERGQSNRRLGRRIVGFLKRYSYAKSGLSKVIVFVS